MELFGIIFWLLFLGFFFGLPFLLTGFNVYFLFGSRFPKAREIGGVATVILGLIFTGLLFSLYDFKEWSEPIILYGDIWTRLHSPLSYARLPALLLLTLLACAGYILLSLRMTRLPPLVIVLSLAAAYIGCVLAVLFMIQLYPPTVHTGLGQLGYCFYLLPLNFILLVIRLTRDLVRAMPAYTAGGRTRFTRWLARTMTGGARLPLLAFIGIWPLLGLCIVVLVLFGQPPDAFLRVFTDTSDWLFSTKTPPPPIQPEPSGHYLCTAAARGHRRIVRPLRPGVRHGKRIIVNRQLCVANAFEQLISDRFPRLHRLVRGAYDKYGYPLSRHIRTPLAADITWLLMKPLEWLFVLVLYLFDRRPEARIAAQYPLPEDHRKTERP